MLLDGTAAVGTEGMRDDAGYSMDEPTAAAMVALARQLERLNDVIARMETEQRRQWAKSHGFKFRKRGA